MKQTLGRAFVFVTTVALAACTSFEAPHYARTDQVQTNQPNIILVLTDDLGYGNLGFTGATAISTPYLDQMAQEGVLLTSFYAAANVCTPSRAGLLTGRYPVRMGLATDVVRPESTHGLPQSETTIAELLQAEGYQTAMIGKWHLGHLPEFWPTQHGFETFYGVRYSNDMQPFGLYDQSELIEEPVDQTTLTRRYTERAIDIIEASDDRPFFLYLAHTFPHIPLFAEDPFLGRSEAGPYGDTVETIDWSMGQIFQALEQAGKDRDTLVIFTSDNGPWFEGSSGDSRNRKGSTWEGAFRVPFIARWPGVLPDGVVSDAPVSGLDILPTLAAITGTKSNAVGALDGRDIWPVLEAGAASPHETLFFFDQDQIAAVRADDHRLVLRSYYRTLDIPHRLFNYPLLFNLQTDPGESYSLTEREPELVERLLAIVDAEYEALGIEQRNTLVITQSQED
jgi:arylsulfatase A